MLRSFRVSGSVSFRNQLLQHDITAIEDGYRRPVEKILRGTFKRATLAFLVLHTITCERVLMYLQYSIGYLPTRRAKGPYVTTSLRSSRLCHRVGREIAFWESAWMSLIPDAHCEKVSEPVTPRKTYLAICIIMQKYTPLFKHITERFSGHLPNSWRISLKIFK